MNLRTKTAKSSVMLAGGEMVSYGASFLRNMILARVLAKADFGIAATFAMIMMLLEFSAKLGIGRYVIRHKDGDAPSFLATAHSVNAASGILSSALILLLSPVLANLFQIDPHRWALSLLAVVVFVQGFQHLDMSRLQRRFRFGPSILVDAIPQVLVTLVTWPLALWLQDFRVVLALLLIKAVASCMLSHAFAERRYQLGWDKDHVAEMLRFGWPLIINGFLFFGITQGEQFLVAIFYGMEDLAPYAAAAALVNVPFLVFSKIASSLFLPVLAKAEDHPPTLLMRYRQVGTVYLLYTLASSIALITGAEALMQTAYGQKYAGTGFLMGWLAAASAFRTLRAATVLTAIARGDSKSGMLANLARLLSILPALYLVSTGKPLWTLPAVALVGEALAGWISLLRLKHRDGIPPKVSLPLYGYLAVLLPLAGAAAGQAVHCWPTAWALLVAALAGLLAICVLAVVIPESRSEVRRLYHLDWSLWIPRCPAKTGSSETHSS